MDRIHYAGDSILTGTEIAAALLEYAKTLAKLETSATVDIPTRLNDGGLGRSKLLIGPASQLVADAEKSEFEEVHDSELVAGLVHETKRLRAQMSNSAVIGSSGEQESWLDDF